MPKIEIRGVTDEEWELWRDLRLGALSEAPYAFGSTLSDWSGDNDREERWRDRLRTNAVSFVSEADGVPCGMVAVYSKVAGDCELISMWVSPKFRGMGVGDALIAAVLEFANDQGFEQVHLSVKEANARAVDLYLRNDFEFSSSVEPRSGCELAMVRSIAGEVSG